MQQELKEIIELAKSGNHIAFKKIVERYQQYAFNLAFRILCDEEEAKDAVQDSFIKIWKNLNTFNTSHKFTTWMYKIVTHTAIDQYRKNSSNKTISIYNIEFSITETLENTDQNNQDNIEMARLISILAKGLPEKQRMVFILRDIQGFRSTEVQEILEVSEKVVKSNLYHARKSVKGKLTKLTAYERRLK